MQTRYVVFLPVRNGENYIASAIKSVLSQTHDDWKLIVLDNKSTDATQSIVAALADARITTVCAEQPLSIEESWARIRRTMIDLDLSEEYCTLLGHDDLLAPTFLESIDHLVEIEPDATLYQTMFDLIDADGRLIRPCRPVPRRETAVDFIADRCWGLRDSFGTGYVFRARDYLAIGGIPSFPRLLYADDVLFARLAQLGYKVCAQSIQSSYRLHRRSTSSNLSVDLYGASLEALSLYVDLLEAEWSDFAVSPPGRAAIAALLAREVMIFTGWPLNSLLTVRLQNLVLRLAAAFHTKSDGVRFTQWLGSNVLSREGYIFSKSVYLSTLFAASRLRWRSTISSRT